MVFALIDQPKVPVKPEHDGSKQSVIKTVLYLYNVTVIDLLLEGLWFKSEGWPLLLYH